MTTTSMSSLVGSVNALDERITRLEHTPNRPNPAFEPDGEALTSFVGWLCDHYALDALTSDWEKILPIKHELAALCRARALDDGTAFYLVTFHDALARFINRAESIRVRWEAQEETRRDLADRVDREQEATPTPPSAGRG